jgi:F-type H+-transporting ATPase subunit gamma
MQSLRRRIDGAGDLEGVVRAMKALAASSIGQYEKAVRSLDDYYRTVELGLSVCLRQAVPPGPAARKHVKGSGPIGAVVFGSDQGLVGRFNEVVADLALKTFKTFPGKVQKIWAVGERVHSLMADSVPTPVDLLSVPTSVNGITRLVGRVLVRIEASREKGEVVDVCLFHNHPKSGAVYEPVCTQLLPLDAVWQSKLFVLLFQACAESLNSENASRLAAMRRAEKNINKILEDLNRKFYSIRQESIDEELFDVVSGFEALTARGK